MRGWTVAARANPVQIGGNKAAGGARLGLGPGHALAGADAKRLGMAGVQRADAVFPLAARAAAPGAGRADGIGAAGEYHRGARIGAQPCQYDGVHIPGKFRGIAVSLPADRAQDMVRTQQNGPGILPGPSVILVGRAQRWSSIL